jgi:hypothetical protein
VCGPTRIAVEGADPGFATGSPLDCSAVHPAALVDLAGIARSTLARDHHGADPAIVLDAGLAVVAIGGDGPRAPPGPADDPPDRGGPAAELQQGCRAQGCGRGPHRRRYPRPGPCSRTQPAARAGPFAIGRTSPSCELTRRVAASGLAPRVDRRPAIQGAAAVAHPSTGDSTRGLHPTPGRGDPPHRLRQQSRIGREATSAAATMVSARSRVMSASS